jgi:hypothetical protein
LKERAISVGKVCPAVTRQACLLRLKAAQKAFIRGALLGAGLRELPRGLLLIPHAGQHFAITVRGLPGESLRSALGFQTAQLLHHLDAVLTQKIRMVTGSMQMSSVERRVEVPLSRFNGRGDSAVGLLDAAAQLRNLCEDAFERTFFTLGCDLTKAEYLCQWKAVGHSGIGTSSRRMS